MKDNILSVSPPQTTILPFCISFPGGWFWSLSPVQCYTPLKWNFLSEGGKETEESNRMGNTRDLFKKIRDTKGALHAKMGTIKDRNEMDLKQAEDIKKWWE